MRLLIRFYSAFSKLISDVHKSFEVASLSETEIAENRRRTIDRIFITIPWALLGTVINFHLINEKNYRNLGVVVVNNAFIIIFMILTLMVLVKLPKK